MSNRLTNLYIIKRGDGVVDAQIENVGRGDWVACQIRIAFDSGEVARADISDTISRACLEFDQTGGGIRALLQDNRRLNSRVAPVAFVAAQDEFVTTIPIFHLIWASANGVI